MGHYYKKWKTKYYIITNKTFRYYYLNNCLMGIRELDILFWKLEPARAQFVYAFTNQKITTDN